MTSNALYSPFLPCPLCPLLPCPPLLPFDSDCTQFIALNLFKFSSSPLASFTSSTSSYAALTPSLLLSYPSFLSSSSLLYSLLLLSSSVLLLFFSPLLLFTSLFFSFLFSPLLYSLLFLSSLLPYIRTSSADFPLNSIYSCQSSVALSALLVICSIPLYALLIFS